MARVWLLLPSGSCIVLFTFLGSCTTLSMRFGSSLCPVVSVVLSVLSRSVLSAFVGQTQKVTIHSDDESFVIGYTLAIFCPSLWPHPSVEVRLALGRLPLELEVFAWRYFGSGCRRSWSWCSSARSGRRGACPACTASRKRHSLCMTLGCSQAYSTLGRKNGCA